MAVLHDADAAAGDVPDRLLGLPADLITGLQKLPSMARNLDTMTSILARVAADTRALPALRKDLRKVGEATTILEPMDGRMANIEKTLPIEASRADGRASSVDWSPGVGPPTT